ncbi:hypothetical protein JTE90_003622 [Oedothorax gibbosus]|uniref:Uncharacterized protein n=1 Tax=Oedothorax gibbosus TaxID=931172 RepID=A0AAV6VBI5_9ARAC|nr:hypothetical protein JTE90_003622 [Oedothorax gibbosus]
MRKLGDIFKVWSTRRSLTIACFLFCSLQNVSGTEVTDTVWRYDNSLGIKIAIPVLACHSKDIGYKEVSWYKDSTILKNGSSDPANHQLSLIDLLKNDDELLVQFEHPLRLQGYYWCETDLTKGPDVHRYLFRIDEINTFVGKFVAVEDSLGINHELTVQEKLTRKMAVYQREMQEVLFGFLPRPNTHVVDIHILQTGLEVRFYLYARRMLDPRQPRSGKLVGDQDELDSVQDYLHNRTSEVDVNLYAEMTDWTHLRGIDIRRIVLRSTLGCYEKKGLAADEPPREITWPYARIGEVVIPREGCSSKNGLAVTRLCTGSFYTGAKWGTPTSECDDSPKELTAQLTDLYNQFGYYTTSLYLEKLNKLAALSSNLTVTDIHIVINTLTALSVADKISASEMAGIFSTIDQIANTYKQELDIAKSTIKLTSRLLQIISNVLLKASQTKQEVLIAKDHILVDTKNTQEKEGHVFGLAIKFSPKELKKGLSKTFVEFLFKGKSVPSAEDTLAYFLLPPDLVFKREKEASPTFQTQVDVVLFKDWSLFPSPKNVLKKKSTKLLPSPVMYVSITGGPAWNITSGVYLYFKDDNARRYNNPVCVQFDPRMEEGEGAWNSEGCRFGGQNGGFYRCICHHLSIFAVVLTEGDVVDSEFRLGTAVYIGCAASIIALSFTVILYCLSKVWRKTVDHSLLFWLALSLLCFIVLLFTSETKWSKAYGCKITAFLLHYVLLVMVMWLLVQALMHRLRFAKKTDMEEVPHFILKAAGCCWGFPTFILIIIWFTKDYKLHKEDNCFGALCDVSRWTLIPVAVFLLVTLCLNMCAVYAVTCRFKKDYLIGNLGYDESVLKFRVALTIYFFFVMTYLFGFFALHKKSHQLRILFSISITITAYYLSLFFVFQEVSVWEMCSKWKIRRRGKSEREPVKYVASKNYTEESVKTS